MVIFEDYVTPLPPKVIPQFHLQSRVKHNHKSPPMISPFPRAGASEYGGYMGSSSYTHSTLQTHSSAMQIYF